LSLTVYAKASSAQGMSRSTCTKSPLRSDWHFYFHGVVVMTWQPTLVNTDN